VWSEEANLCVTKEVVEPCKLGVIGLIHLERTRQGEGVTYSPFCMPSRRCEENELGH
jgi:hypothetical protein